MKGSLWLWLPAVSKTCFILYVINTHAPCALCLIDGLTACRRNHTTFDDQDVSPLFIQAIRIPLKAFLLHIEVLIQMFSAEGRRFQMQFPFRRSVDTEKCSKTIIVIKGPTSKLTGRNFYCQLLRLLLRSPLFSSDSMSHKCHSSAAQIKRNCEFPCRLYCTVWSVMCSESVIFPTALRDILH